VPFGGPPEVEPWVGSLHNLANVYEEQGRLRDAKAHWLRAVEAEPRYVPALHALGKFVDEQARRPRLRDRHEGRGLTAAETSCGPHGRMKSRRMMRAASLSQWSLRS
jgi:hypothetical protein